METQEDRDRAKKESRRQAILDWVAVSVFILTMAIAWGWVIYQTFEIIKLASMYLHWRY